MGVYRTLYAFTGGRADVAEDATAEAFARALAQRDDLRDPLAWIYRAAFRVGIDELRADLLRSAGGCNRGRPNDRHGDGFQRALDREANVQDVPFLHEVVLPLDAHLAGGLRPLHRAGRDQLVIADHVRADESPLRSEE